MNQVLCFLLLSGFGGAVGQVKSCGPAAESHQVKQINARWSKAEKISVALLDGGVIAGSNVSTSNKQRSNLM